MTRAGPVVSVILPTLNEAANLALLVPRISRALAGREHEILVVDDHSTDDTPAVCAELARQGAFSVRIQLGRLLRQTPPTRSLQLLLDRSPDRLAR